MKPLLTVGVLLAIAAVAALVIRRYKALRAAEEKWPFYVRKPLSQPEQVLFHRLVKALPDHLVLAQVQVSRVLGVQKGFNFYKWNNRIDRLSYDFVVCRKDSIVVVAIELDDRTHEYSHRIRTDEKKDRATVDAGLRLIRWNVRALPSEEDIRATVVVPKSLREIEGPPESFSRVQ